LGFRFLLFSSFELVVYFQRHRDEEDNYKKEKVVTDMWQEEWLLKMCLLHIYHKGRCGSWRHGRSLWQRIAARRKQKVRCIHDYEKAGNADNKIDNVSLTEIQLWDKHKVIEIEKADKHAVQGQLMISIGIKLKPIDRQIRGKQNRKSQET
jgi:hypothetical protein